MLDDIIYFYSKADRSRVLWRFPGAGVAVAQIFGGLGVSLGIGTHAVGMESTSVFLLMPRM